MLRFAFSLAVSRPFFDRNIRITAAALLLAPVAAVLIGGQRSRGHRHRVVSPGLATVRTDLLGHESADDDSDRTEVRTRRHRCGTPDDEHHRPKWMMVVQMLDALAEHGLRPPLLVADAHRAPAHS